MRFWISGFRGPAGSPEQADYTLVRPNAERGSRITTCSVRGALDGLIDIELSSRVVKIYEHDT